MRRTVVVWLLCLLFAPQPARAEWHFTPTFGVTFAGSTTLYDAQNGTGKRHLNVGGIVSHFGKGVIGFEGMFGYTRHFFEFDGPRDSASIAPVPIARSYTMSAMGNVVVTVPKRWTEYFLRPYVSGGFGVLRAVSIDEPQGTVQPESVLPQRSIMPGFDVGGGAIGFLSQNTGIRFDVRYYGGLRRQPAPGEIVVGPDLHFRYMTAEIGLVIRR